MVMLHVLIYVCNLSTCICMALTVVMLHTPRTNEGRLPLLKDGSPSLVPASTQPARTHMTHAYTVCLHGMQGPLTEWLHYLHACMHAMSLTNPPGAMTSGLIR